MIGWNEEIKKSLAYCGTNVFIGHNVLFANPDKIYLGNNVRIDPFTWITTGLKTGNNIQICSHAVLSGGKEHDIILGDWCFIGYGSKLFCASEDYSGDYGPVNDYWGQNKIFKGNISFNNFSGVASDVIVMPDITLPEGCLIGAKSFVYKKDKLIPWSVWLGNPLVLHKKRDQNTVINKSKDPNFLRKK